jgi:hypothetical protein
LGIALAVNLVVDPFDTFRVVEIAGFNTYKPFTQTRLRLLKAHEVRLIRPRAIVLGTSRTHIAIRMTHPGWDAHAVPRYNLAFDGATTEEMYEYLRHAQAVQPLHQVVLGLDTWHLGGNESFARPDFDAGELYNASPLSTLSVAATDLRLLLSFDTLMASYRTVRIQDEEQPAWLARDGQRLGDVFFHSTGEEFVTDGPGAYFASDDQEEVDSATDEGPATPPARLAAPEAVSPPLSSFEYIRKIVKFCRAENIDLRIFITPAHAHNMEIEEAVGSASDMEDGKRDLVQLLAEDAARHPGAKPFPLWDFSDYSSITTEDVPPPGTRREMKYYWDSSHAKELVGDFVLDRLFGTTRAGHPIPPDFGIQLTPQTIDAAMAKIRNDERRYRSEHPKDVAEIFRLVYLAQHRQQGNGQR